jgi:CubicO group peptidase (beta-lactamase class C family)
MVGTGDVWSTAADLARFTTSIHQGALLSKASLAKLTRACTPVTDSAIPYSDWITAESYGYGLFLGTAAGTPAVFHTGDLPGYRTITVWLPEHAVSIAVLTNDDTADIEQILRQLHAATLTGLG